MGSSSVPDAGGGLSVGRFPIASNQPFNIPAGITLRNTVTTTTTFTAGQLPAQVWAVVVGGGGSGGANASTSAQGGGGGAGVKIGWVDVPSTGITATIGAGGVAIASGTNANGNRGGSTVFGSVLVHGGGGGCGNGGTVLDTGVAIPFTEGMPGYGGNATSGAWFVATNSFGVYPNCAPFATNPGSFALSSQASILSAVSNVVSRGVFNNYVGGGAGGVGAGFGGAAGGAGFTGGGGGASNGNGGGSSRDGGITNTFTGGTNSGSGSGGGAGFLANGSNAAGVTGGAGGSGGGGGGAGGVNGASGAGGAGCVLIYY